MLGAEVPPQAEKARARVRAEIKIRFMGGSVSENPPVWEPDRHESE